MKRKKTRERLQLKRTLPRVTQRFHRPTSEERSQEAISSLPRITNETVAEHREKVLGSARKYIYPLEHSKHRIIVVSVSLLIVAVIGFFVYCGLELYKFQSTSSFIYRVTQVLPFPVAKAGSRYVAYENYLFEVRRYEHYYQTQQRVDFGSAGGKQQLATYKPKAMKEVVDAAYTKQLAASHHISVSSREVNDALDSLKAQNQLSGNNQELADVTNEFFGWSIDDLKRELKQELLAQKVAAALDTTAQAKANAALVQLKKGTAFATLAGKVSEDGDTKAKGGEYANQAITSASTDVPPAVVRALQKLKPGQYSTVIQAGSTLEIVKLLENNDGKMKAAHISFNVRDISDFIAPLEKANPPHYYISVK
jgi:hypothetical protein